MIKKLLPAAIVAASFAAPSHAAIEVYNQDATSFSVDGFFNTFYVNSSSDNIAADTSRDTARVKMGFLPNYVGFNFGSEIDGLKVGGRSSFWVTINDSDTAATTTGIDVRQFYATVDGDFGQILIGKDFTLFNRSNIFLDEMLAGYGAVNDSLALIDGQGVSFGNIGSGYTYPFPHAQITYRTKDMNGFQIAIGLIDPAGTTADGMDEESAPRFEAEATYSTSFDGGSVKGWLGMLSQSSDSTDPTIPSVDSRGVSYGVQVKAGGLTVHASGFDGEGMGLLLGPADMALTSDPVNDPRQMSVWFHDGEGETETKGSLVQASYVMGKARIVASYGTSELEDSAGNSMLEMETTQFGVFYSVNSRLTLVGEFNTNEITGVEEVDTFAFGATVGF